MYRINRRTFAEVRIIAQNLKQDKNIKYSTLFNYLNDLKSLFSICIKARSLQITDESSNDLNLSVPIHF